MNPLPAEVELELKQFLEGALGYEFKKRRKNSKSTEAFRIFRVPSEIGNEPQGSVKNKRRSKSLQTEFPRGIDGGGSIGLYPTAERNLQQDSLSSGRKSERRGHAVSVGDSSSGTVSSADLALKEDLPVVIPLVTPEPKRRGRPPKTQEIPSITVNASSSIAVVEIVEPTNVKRKYTRKPKPTDDLGLGCVALLTPIEEVVTTKTKRKSSKAKL